MTLIAQQNQIVRHNENKISFCMPSPAEMENLVSFCKVMASAPFYQKLGPGGVMAIYLTAKEYDLPLMACLNGGLHTFDGKVTFSAIMIDALILKAGHKTDLLHLDDKSCKIRFTRADRVGDPSYKPLEYEYTTEQARIAGYLTKNNWKTSLRDMLYSRCLTGGGRKHIPEAFVGVLVVGELVGSEADANVPPQVPSHIQEVNESKEKVVAPVVSEGEKEKIEEFKLLYLSEFGEALKRYIALTCEKANLEEEKVWELAFKNETSFKERFLKWEKENPHFESSQVE